MVSIPERLSDCILKDDRIFYSPRMVGFSVESFLFSIKEHQELTPSELGLSVQEYDPETTL